MLSPNLLLLREKLGVGSSLPILRCCAGGWGWWRVFLSLSYLFWCGYFLVCSMCRSCSASFWVSFRGNCSVCSCTFSVSVGRREFRSLLCCHLGLELVMGFSGSVPDSWGMWVLTHMPLLSPGGEVVVWEGVTWHWVVPRWGRCNMGSQTVPLTPSSVSKLVFFCSNSKLKLFHWKSGLPQRFFHSWMII